MTKPLIYVETTVISYYTSRPSRDVVVAGHQAVTNEWWERVLPSFTPMISAVVLDEIGDGDADAATKRLAVVTGWEVVELTEEAGTLAEEYFRAIELPEAARADSLHLALATWHGLDYLVTWNCRHIAGARVRQVTQAINERHGLATPSICTPEELMEI
ncbi:MAG: type II toxin-antitoxin system VapC family toxin [Phycisphaeraceae bacterium]